MTRLVLPFPVLFFSVLAFVGILLVQWLVYEVTANVLGKEVWAGECIPQKLQGDNTVELLMLCNGEEVTTSKVVIVLAWINEQQAVECSKEADWHSDDVSWGCNIQEKPVDLAGHVRRDQP